MSEKGTSSVIEVIKSKLNVKLVYPPEADRSARIHCKHNRSPSQRKSLVVVPVALWPFTPV